MCSGWTCRLDAYGMRCKGHRKGGEHYRKCAICGKGHTIGEARENNCLQVTADMMRLRSFNY